MEKYSRRMDTTSFSLMEKPCKGKLWCYKSMFICQLFYLEIIALVNSLPTHDTSMFTLWSFYWIFIHMVWNIPTSCLIATRKYLQISISIISIIILANIVQLCYLVIKRIILFLSNMLRYICSKGTSPFLNN